MVELVGSRPRMTMAHSQTLRDAAAVLRQWTKKPNGLWLKVLCGVLASTADDIDREIRERSSPFRGGRRG